MLAALLFTQAAYAFYNPSAGRWLSRDPIQEKGGICLYRFADNDPQNHVDALGRLTVTYTCRTGRCYLGLGGYRYTCAVTGNLGGVQLYWLAVNAKKFAVCAAEAAGIMNVGCFFEVYEFFAKGCEDLRRCFQLYTTPAGLGGTEPPILFSPP
jgi:hypothetical protein